MSYVDVNLAFSNPVVTHFVSKAQAAALVEGCQALEVYCHEKMQGKKTPPKKSTTTKELAKGLEKESGVVQGQVC